MSELIPRTVKLTAEDWAKADELGEHSSSLWFGSRFYAAAYDARPPVPRTVELDGLTWTEIEDDGWEDNDGLLVPSDSFLGLALVRIWDLEHPDEADCDAEIERLRAAINAVTPDDFGCNAVEIERDRFGVYVHVNHNSIDVEWPDTREADSE